VQIDNTTVEFTLKRAGKPIGKIRRAVSKRRPNANDKLRDNEREWHSNSGTHEVRQAVKKNDAHSFQQVVDAYLIDGDRRASNNSSASNEVAVSSLLNTAQPPGAVSIDAALRARDNAGPRRLVRMSCARWHLRIAARRPPTAALD